MPFLQGFIGGINEGLAGSQAEAAQESARLDELERNIFTTLAQSDDPEIASLALAGLTNLAGPRKRPSSLQRFLGEVEQSPMLGQMRELLQTPVKRTVTEPGEVRPSPGQAGMPQRPYQGLFGAAAMPKKAAVEPGAPLMDMGGGPPQVDLTPTRGPDVTRTISEPRRAFMPPEEMAGRKMRTEIGARMGASIEAFRGAKTDEERDLIMAMMGSPRRQPTLREGEIIEDPESHTGYSQVLYDQETGAVKRIPSGPPRSAGLHKSKVQDPTSKTGWSDVYSQPDGTEAYRVKGVSPTYPPSAYSGVYYTPGPSGTQVPVGITHEGGTRELPGAPPKAPSDQADELAEAARGVLKQAVAEWREATLGGRAASPGQLSTIIERIAGQDPRLKGKKALEVYQLAERTGAPPPAVEGAAKPTGDLTLDVQKVLDLIRQGQASRRR